MRIVGGILTLGLMALLSIGCSDSSPTSATPGTSPIGASGDTASTGTQPGPEMFRAVLTGEQEVPSVLTRASGSVSFHMSQDGQSIIYALTVSQISDVTAAHIHAGGPGENGPAVVDLFAGLKSGEYNGLLAQGRITLDMLEGHLTGTQMSVLVDMLNSGLAYVNVHTQSHPNGEIRGQITRTPSDIGDN